MPEAVLDIPTPDAIEMLAVCCVVPGFSTGAWPWMPLTPAPLSLDACCVDHNE